MDWKLLFLSAEGRINRQSFWIGFALIFAASVVLNMVPILGQLIGLLLIWPQVCIHAKRLHDMGRTGWWMLAPFAVMMVAMSLAVATGGAALMGAGLMHRMDADVAGAGALIAGLGAASGFMGVAMLTGLAFLLWVGLTPGQPGDNRFGAPPPPGLPGAAPAPPPPPPPIVEP